MRVLYWGTPEFATPPLRALLGEGFEVVGVVTRPDKPRGRSRSTLVPSQVKLVALEEKLPVFQPAKPADPEFLEMLDVMSPDVSVVVAYGQLLPQSVIDTPPLGTLNIHASLLPLLRGAAPIAAAIREGHRETGVTIMRMVLALDAGPSILKAATPIHDDDSAGDLAARLSEMGAVTLVEALALLAAGVAREEPQDDRLATYAPKIGRDDARVDWSAQAVAVSRHIRSVDPKPGAWTTLDGTEVKLFGVREARLGCGRPGEVLIESERGLLVACGCGAVYVLEVQPAGKRRMDVHEWMRGRGIGIGARFGT